MAAFIKLVKYHSSVLSDGNTMGLLKSQFIKLPVPSDDFTGKTVIVTGANSGLGLEAARHFVRLGAAKVILGCRDTEKGKMAKQDIESSTSRKGVTEVWPVDLTSFDSVKAFCRRADGLERLDAVVLNAGVAIGEFVPVDGGYETQIAVNVISTFLMGVMALPKLRETATRFKVVPHVVVVSSDGHFFAKFPERNEPKVFDTYKDKSTMSDDRYNVSKLLVTLVARELAKQMDASANNQVVLNIVTPGFCKSQITRNVPAPGKYGVALMLFLIGRTTEMGSRTLVSAATAGKETHGKYLDSCRIGEPSPFVRSEEGAAVQVKVYAELMGILEGIEPCVTRNVVG